MSVFWGSLETLDSISVRHGAISSLYCLPAALGDLAALAFAVFWFSVDGAVECAVCSA